MSRYFPKFVLFLGLFLFALGFSSFLTACTHRYYRPHKKIVRTYYNKRGCRVRRAIYPCYTRRGNLKIQTVTCPDGRRWKKRWIHPDNRCARPRPYLP